MYQRLKDLNIKMKLTIAFFLLIGLTTLVAAVAVTSQRNIQKNIAHLLNVDVSIGKLALESNNAMLEARRREKDYLLRFKEVGFEEARTEYITTFQNEVSAIHQYMEQIRSVTSEPDIIATTEAIDQAITHYETNFLQTVTLIERRGHVDTGLEGEFRQKVHDIEDITLAQNLDALTIDMLILRRHEKDYLLRGSDKYVTQLHDKVIQFKANVDSTRIALADKSELKNLADEYQNLFDQLVAIDSQIAAATEVYRNDVHQLEPLLAQIMDTAAAGEVLGVANINAVTIATIWIMGAVSLGAILVGLIMAFFLPQLFTKPILAVAATAKQITEQDLPNLVAAIQALANGDLTHDNIPFTAEAVAVQANDEIGQMATSFNHMIVRLQETGTAFNQMTGNLRQLVNQLTETAHNVSNSATHLSDAAKQSRQATEQVATALQQIATGTIEQSVTLNSVTTSVTQVTQAVDSVANGAQEQAVAVAKSVNITDEIVKAIQQVAFNAQTGVNGSHQAAHAAKTGADIITKMIASMESIKTQVDVSVQKVAEMGQRSDQIGAIVQTIEDIASQTNLLALNAAIEAARAGEHGKGFAVVADEVRHLAEESAQATQEITTLIKDIQQTVTQAITAMKASSGEVETGVIRADEAGQALKNILQATGGVNRQIESIAVDAKQMKGASDDLTAAMQLVSAVVEENTAATEEMSTGSNEVREAIRSIADISEASSAAVEEVSASAEEMHAQVEEATSAAKALNSIADQLTSIVSQFKLDNNEDSVDKSKAHRLQRIPTSNALVNATQTIFSPQTAMDVVPIHKEPA